MESYTRGETEPPLLEETIGASFERTVATHPDREALVEGAFLLLRELHEVDVLLDLGGRHGAAERALCEIGHDAADERFAVRIDRQLDVIAQRSRELGQLELGRGCGGGRGCRRGRRRRRLALTARDESDREKVCSHGERILETP